jgi:hypothetical protein
MWTGICLKEIQLHAAEAELEEVAYNVWIRLLDEVGSLRPRVARNAAYGVHLGLAQQLMQAMLPRGLRLRVEL